MKKITVLIVVTLFIISLFALTSVIADSNGDSGNGDGSGSSGGSSGGGSSGGDDGSDSGDSSDSNGDSNGGDADSGSSDANTGNDDDAGGLADDAEKEAEDDEQVTETVSEDGTRTITKIDGDETEIETIRADGTRTITKIEEGETETESISPTGVRTKTKMEEGELKTEILFPDGTRIKTKVEDDETRVEVFSAGTKVRFKREDDRFRITVTNEQGGEAVLDEDKFLIIDERGDKAQIRVKTLQDKVLLEGLTTQALTDLPISVDLETNLLTVTTPAGEKELTVLPDQVVQNMLAANVIDRVGGETLAQSVVEGQVKALDNVITLGEINGVPIYEILGLRYHRLLGFIPVTTDVDVTVSARTGEVLGAEQSFVDTIIDALSTEPAPSPVPAVTEPTPAEPAPQPELSKKTATTGEYTIGKSRF